MPLHQAPAGDLNSRTAPQLPAFHLDSHLDPVAAFHFNANPNPVFFVRIRILIIVMQICNIGPIDPLFIVSLHGFFVSLHGSIVSLHGELSRHPGFHIDEYPDPASLHGEPPRWAFTSSGFSLWWGSGSGSGSPKLSMGIRIICNILYCSGEISGGGREATARGGGGQVRGQPHPRGQVPQEQQGQEGVPHQVCGIFGICSIVRSVVSRHQCFGSS